MNRTRGERVPGALGMGQGLWDRPAVGERDRLGSLRTCSAGSGFLTELAPLAVAFGHLTAAASRTAATEGCAREAAGGVVAHAVRPARTP